MTDRLTIYDELYPVSQRPKVELEKVAPLFYERRRCKVDSCNVTAGSHKYEGATAEATNTLFLLNRKYVQVAFDRNDPNAAVALDDGGHVIALLRLKQFVPHSDEARPIIAESMADRRRKQKLIAGAIHAVSQTARSLGVLTEREHLEIAAGVDAPQPNGTSTAILVIPPRPIRTNAPNTNPERPQSEDIGERLAEQLRRRNGTC